ncbi:MAG: ParB/RepB/Spo0J family partition protein [Gammaproteobacteria bacterium]|nr:ParB/RepB/Spo0J family partition protein [Gammaproteobacteria bacterium]
MKNRRGPSQAHLMTMADGDKREGRETTEPEKPKGQSKESIFNKQEQHLKANAKTSPSKQFLVDPSVCTIWSGHDRFYELLNEESCADLIEQVIAEGKQRFPAIVRKSESPDFDYEVICGARRHWVVSWLRANGNGAIENIEFLIEQREIEDEEAFRLSDIENRDKQDLSDYERAIKYARALKEFKYYASQKEMAQRLNLTEDKVASYIKLADLPETIVAAFRDKRELKMDYARQLNPFLNKPNAKKLILAEAKTIQKIDGKLASSDVLKRLLNAAKPKTKAAPKLEKFELNLQDGKRLIAAQKNRAGTVTIALNGKSGASRSEIMQAFEKMLEEMNL